MPVDVPTPVPTCKVLDLEQAGRELLWKPPVSPTESSKLLSYSDQQSATSPTVITIHDTSSCQTHSFYPPKTGRIKEVWWLAGGTHIAMLLKDLSGTWTGHVVDLSGKEIFSILASGMKVPDHTLPQGGSGYSFPFHSGAPIHISGLGPQQFGWIERPTLLSHGPVNLPHTPCIRYNAVRIQDTLGLAALTCCGEGRKCGVGFGSSPDSDTGTLIILSSADRKVLHSRKVPHPNFVMAWCPGKPILATLEEAPAAEPRQFWRPSTFSLKIIKADTLDIVEALFDRIAHFMYLDWSLDGELIAVGFDNDGHDVGGSLAVVNAQSGYVLDDRECSEHNDRFLVPSKCFWMQSGVDRALFVPALGSVLRFPGRRQRSGDQDMMCRSMAWDVLNPADIQVEDPHLCSGRTVVMLASALRAHYGPERAAVFKCPYNSRGDPRSASDSDIESSDEDENGSNSRKTMPKHARLMHWDWFSEEAVCMYESGHCSSRSVGGSMQWLQQDGLEAGPCIYACILDGSACVVHAAHHTILIKCSAADIRDMAHKHTGNPPLLHMTHKDYVVSGIVASNHRRQLVIRTRSNAGQSYRCPGPSYIP